MNLAVNARDAMPKGGQLIVETTNVDLQPGGSYSLPPGGYALLRVSDTGISMDEETRARIFEPFFTTKPMEKGTGLGLATVYGIVKQSGGHIWVHTTPGRGTSFEIYFPVAEASAQPHPEPRGRVTAPRGEETILVVEDEPALRQLIRTVLSTHGYTVLDAPDGTTAVRLGREHAGTIHLLLTDVILPGMNGLEIARELSGVRPDVRVLFISGYARDTALAQGSLPGTSFLHKPFSPDALVQKVHEVLRAGLDQ